VIEAVTALVLGLLVVQLSLGVLARARSAEARLTARAESLEAVRIARHIVGREVRRGRAGRDWTVFGRDSLVLRAFRGVGEICPWRPGVREILVAYRGVREADASKDSVLLMDRDGTWTARALVWVGGSDVSCPQAPTVAVERWRLDRDAPAGVVLARVFERGSYHLTGGALRYRRGAAGRQPLTPEVLRTPPSGFDRSGDAVVLLMTPDDGAGAVGAPWRSLVWRGSDGATR
jgi:hypothetical protein